MEEESQADSHRRYRLQDWFDLMGHDLYGEEPDEYNENALFARLNEVSNNIQQINETLTGNPAYHILLEQATILANDPGNQDAIQQMRDLYEENHFSLDFGQLIQQSEELEEVVPQLAPTLSAVNLTPNVVWAQTTSLECHDTISRLIYPLEIVEGLPDPDEIAEENP